MLPLAPRIKEWVNATLALCYPEVCQLCGSSRATHADGFVCAGCRAQVRFIDPPFCQRCGTPYQGQITTVFECTNCRELALDFSSARSAVIAGEAVLDIIHRYKYNRALYFEPFLADLLLSRAVPALATATWDLIVPVPLHHTRLREREFNQAELDVFPGAPVLKDGYYWANDKPGWGMDVDEKVAPKFPVKDDPPFDMSWGNLRRRDGAITKP